MANPEHMRIVRGGAEVLEQWREKNPDVRLDLEGADLSGVKVSMADLSNAILEGAKLVGANLGGVNLDSAHLDGANLEGADLRGAQLGDADLSETDLSRTDLRDSDLWYTNLTSAVVSGANFEGALLYETVLGDMDLSGVRGLENMQHQGPSVIDERTLRRSWPLPEVFLRGVGLSDQYIEYLPSLMGQAIEFYSCFISYSSKDNEFSRRLHADLQAEGVRCWFAPEDLRIGDKFRTRIDEAIRLHDKLLLILSEDSVNSTWVEDEVESALEKERKAKERGEERTVLFPIRLDSAVMETDAAWAANIRRTRHIGDFSAWKDHDAYQEAFDRLLRDLKSGATKE